MSDTLATINELKLTHHNHPAFIVYTMAVHSTALDKCWKTCNHHYGLPWCLSGKESACSVETWVWFLGQKDSKAMAPHSSILAWKIPWTGKPNELQSMGSQGIRQNWMTQHACNHHCGIKQSIFLCAPIFILQLCLPHLQKPLIFLHSMYTHIHMEEWTGSELGKEYIKALYCHPAYLTYMQSTSWKMLGWMKHKVESRLPGEISITSDMQMTPALWQKAKSN